MTLPNLRSDQHAQILGFSIVGYGVSFLINFVGPLLHYLMAWNSTRDRLSDPAVHLGGDYARVLSDYSTDLAIPVLLYGFVMFAICGLTGLIIKSGHPDPKVFGLIFVVLCFGLFPLGTIVSIYALIYIFVIYEAEGENPEGAIKLN